MWCEQRELPLGSGGCFCSVERKVPVSRQSSMLLHGKSRDRAVCSCCRIGFGTIGLIRDGLPNGELRSVPVVDRGIFMLLILFIPFVFREDVVAPPNPVAEEQDRDERIDCAGNSESGPIRQQQPFGGDQDIERYHLRHKDRRQQGDPKILMPDGQINRDRP